MKKLFSVLALSAIVAACGGNNETDGDTMVDSTAIPATDTVMTPAVVPTTDTVITTTETDTIHGDVNADSVVNP